MLEKSPVDRDVLIIGSSSRFSRHRHTASVCRPENNPFALSHLSIDQGTFHGHRSPVTADQCKGAIKVCHQAKAHPPSYSSTVQSRAGTTNSFISPHQLRYSGTQLLNVLNSCADASSSRSSISDLPISTTNPLVNSCRVVMTATSHHPSRDNLALQRTNHTRSVQASHLWDVSGLICDVIDV